MNSTSNTPDKSVVIDEILNFIMNQYESSATDDEIFDGIQHKLGLEREYFNYTIKQLERAKLIDTHSTMEYHNILTSEGMRIWSLGGINGMRLPTKQMSQSLKKMERANFLMLMTLIATMFTVALAVYSMYCH